MGEHVFQRDGLRTAHRDDAGEAGVQFVKPVGERTADVGLDDAGLDEDRPSG